MLDDYADLVAAGAVTVACDPDVAGLVVLIDRSDHLLIDNIAVDPARQRLGIGRTLMAHAEAEAAQRGHREIRLYTHQLMTENIAAYRRACFVEIGRATQNGYDRVFFAKPVGA